MNDVAKYFDTFLKVATTGALIGVALLGTRFVTKEEFRDANARIEKMEAVLIRMEAQYETDRRHDSLLADHESRLRSLEKN
jgi:hypothetical protein